MTKPVKSLDTGEEVLFLTSNDRLVDAYYRWYEKTRPGNPSNFNDSAGQVRDLWRYLKVPTTTEVERYRRDQFHHG